VIPFKLEKLSRLAKPPIGLVFTALEATNALARVQVLA